MSRVEELLRPEIRRMENYQVRPVLRRKAGCQRESVFASRGTEGEADRLAYGKKRTCGCIRIQIV